MNESTTSLLQRVDRYYREKGISPGEFNKFACPFKNKCVRCAKYPSKFAPGQEALVTTGYERRALPRLLILSAEPARAGKISSQRKALAVREWEENEYIPEKGKGRLRHWREVHQVAWYILRCFRPKLALKETRHFIAHTNSAKCCVNNRDSQQARSELFDNCQGFIGSELKLLAPDILVTQGEPAEKVVLEHFRLRRKKYLRQRSSSAVNKNKWYRAEISMRGRRVLWLRTPHPGMRKAGGSRGKLTAKELDRMYRRCAEAVLKWKMGTGRLLAARPRVLLRILNQDKKR